MPDKTLLITRPLGDEQQLATHLQERDYRIIHEPLTSITLEHTQRMMLAHELMQDPNAVIVTSRHAVHALALLTDLRDIFLLCVGDATARAAQAFGFDRISTGGGTVDKLVEFITSSYDPGSRFLYVSGAHTRIDLADALATYDMEVQRVVVYQAEAADQLSDTLVEQIRRKQVDGVTLLSPRTAQIFIRLLQKSGQLQDAATHITALCISEATADALFTHGWKMVHVAKEPTLASLVQCIDNAYGGAP
jgi:uroporphyrinogen-III synthase